MKQIFLVFILHFALSSISYSQNYDEALFEKNFYIAEDFLDKEDFQKALFMFKELLKMDTENANLNFKTGFCYLNTVLEKKQSIAYLQKAIKNVNLNSKPENHLEKSAPVETYFYLAKAYHLNYQFEKAINLLDTLKIIVPDYRSEFTENIDWLEETCKYGIELMKYPVKIFVTNLGNTINSEYDEHSPVFSADESTLIFTSKRKGTTGGKMTDDGQYFEDIYISQRKDDGTWTVPVSISSNINTPGHEASIGLSVDGQELFIYKDESNVINQKDGNIYYSKLEGDIWSKPIKLGPTINTKYNENHASLSADGEQLYFTSNRPGGYGGMDIYFSNKLPNGEWGEAQNLGTIVNSAEDEIGPYIHPDGVTLFFSSKGHANMGGFDIFFSTKDEEGVWTEPTNIGYPINTTADDVFYIPTPDGMRAYYASQQTGGIGCNDIYLITLPKSEEKLLTVMSGIITMSDGTLPKNITITVTDKDTKEVVGIYTPNSKTGKYLFILNSGKNYNVTIEADNFLPYTNDLYVKEGTSYREIEQAVKLEPVILGEQLTKEYYFHFEPMSTKLNDKEFNDLVTIAKKLQSSKYAEIILPMGPYNADLNFVRAEIITENLVDYKVSEKKIKILKQPSVSKESIQLYIVPNKNEGTIAQNNLTNQTTGVNVPEIKCVFFNFNEYSINTFIENLNNLGQWLVLNTGAVIEIIGHTDDKGSIMYNNELSLRRANFVKKYLINRGVKANQIKIKGAGKSTPVAKNIDEESRKFNRRVEFKLIKDGTTPITFKPIEVPEQYKLNKK